MRAHFALALSLVLLPIAAQATDDICGLLTDAQWAELGLTSAKRTNVPTLHEPDKFNTLHELKGTTCHVMLEDPQRPADKSNPRAKAEFDAIAFTPLFTPEDEARVVDTLASELQKFNAEPPSREISHLPLTQGYCGAVSIDMMQMTATWCVGVRHSGVLIVSIPEPYLPGGAYMPMKTKVWFEVVARQLAIRRRSAPVGNAQ